MFERSEAWKDDGDDLAYSHTMIILRAADEFYYAHTRHRHLSSDKVDPDGYIQLQWTIFFLPSYQTLPLHLSHYRSIRISNVLISLVTLKTISFVLATRYWKRDGLASFRGNILIQTSLNIWVALLKATEITGLCFRKYDVTLADRLNNPTRPFHRDKCLAAIECGIRHLHSLGIIHNDVNLYNIMLNSDDTPMIIVFDSCRRQGDKLLNGGTSGWTDDTAEFARPENDYYGLRKIHEALKL